MQPESLAVILSRIQFGFTVSFHIILPAFTVGLAVCWIFRGRVRDEEGYTPGDDGRLTLAMESAGSHPAAAHPAGPAERVAGALSVTALVALSLRNVVRRRR